MFTHKCDTGNLSALIQCWNIVRQIERDCSALPNVGPYIYDVSISGFTRSSIYIYDISSLRVKMVTWKKVYSMMHGQKNKTWHQTITGPCKRHFLPHCITAPLRTTLPQSRFAQHPIRLEKTDAATVLCWRMYEHNAQDGIRTEWISGVKVFDTYSL